MAATQTSYIDQYGNKQKGYIINDSTFSDEGGTTPVGVGSVVDAGGTQWLKLDSGSRKLDEYLNENGIVKTTTRNSTTGENGIGYIKDGTTYIDPLLKYRVGNGTVVTDGGGKEWIKTDNGSMLYSDYLNQQQPIQPQKSDSMRQLEDQMANINSLYEKALANNDATMAAQLERQKAAVQQQIDGLNQRYADLNRQLYRDYMMNQKNMPELLAAQGLGGGLQESSLIRLAAGYESDLAANERARETGIRDLETGGRDAELQLQIEQARANQQAEDNAYARMLAVQQAMMQQQRYDEERERAAEDTQYERAYQNAVAIGKATGDYSALYELAGYTPQAAAQPTYNPGYYPSPSPVPDPGKYQTGSQKSDAILQGAKIMQANGGDDYAAAYIGAQLNNGNITKAEAQKILDVLNGQ